MHLGRIMPGFDELGSSPGRTDTSNFSSGSDRPSPLAFRCASFPVQYAKKAAHRVPSATVAKSLDSSAEKKPAAISPVATFVRIRSMSTPSARRLSAMRQIS